MNKVHARSPTTRSLADLPNVGPATLGDFTLLGIHTPADLVGRDPDVLYEALCEATGARHDPCARDVFAAVIRHVEGGPALPWWYESRRRKAGAAKGPRR